MRAFYNIMTGRTPHTFSDNNQQPHRCFRQIFLYRIPSFLGADAEEEMELAQVSLAESDAARHLGVHILEGHEVAGHLRRSEHLTGSVQTQQKQVHHQVIVLDPEGGKLDPPDDAVAVVHVLVVDRHVVPGSHLGGVVILGAGAVCRVGRCTGDFRSRIFLSQLLSSR